MTRRWGEPKNRTEFRPVSYKRREEMWKSRIFFVAFWAWLVGLLMGMVMFR